MIQDLVSSLHGRLSEVWTVHVKGDMGDILGVFPQYSQAEGYLKHELAAESFVSEAIIQRRPVFIPDGEEELRAFMLAPDFGPYIIAVDYEPDEAKKQRELRQSALAKLTPEEREALGV